MSNNPFATTSNQEIQPSSRFNYADWRERFILTILQIGCVFAIPMIVLSFPTASISDRILFIGSYIGLAAITVLPSPYLVRVYALLFTLFAVGVNAILSWGPWADGNIFLLACVLLSALLLDRRTDVILLSVSVVFTTLISIFQQTGVYRFSGTAVPLTVPADWLTYCANFIIVGIVLVAAIGQFKAAFARVIEAMQSAFDALTAERVQLEGKVQARTEDLEFRMSQLRKASTITKIMAEMQNISELLDSVTKLTSEKFDYYHVGLYILDENKKIAFLQSASSITGKQMIGHGIRVEFDKRNPISLAARQNHHVISSDSEGINFLRDTNFPSTRSRMALPLAVRGNILGVLDMHSDRAQVFNNQDAEILQTLADLVAISFDNARLMNETRSLLSQLEINTSIQTERTWKKLTSRQKPAYQYTPAGVRPVFSTSKRENNGEGLQVPLVLHGQRVGMVKLKRKGESASWSERERILVEKIADQIALALENSRLVDEAQKGALRDQMIANVSTHVRETLDIEAVVRTAATELRRAFDLKEAEILIGAPQTDMIQKGTFS
ncbi:MAG: GAF domain-containing protein [Anaerolineales bacterium]|nr:GAF domain-containing protein [Anaerolineales bacterium]